MTDSERLAGSRKPSQSSVSRPVGFDPERMDLWTLTKPQRRILLETAKVPEGARWGYKVTGTQWASVFRLRKLGLIYVDGYSGHFCRDTMWLRPTDKGRAWAAHAISAGFGTECEASQSAIARKDHP